MCGLFWDLWLIDNSENTECFVTKQRETIIVLPPLFFFFPLETSLHIWIRSQGKMNLLISLCWHLSPSVQALGSLGANQHKCQPSSCEHMPTSREGSGSKCKTIPWCHLEMFWVYLLVKLGKDVVHVLKSWFPVWWWTEVLGHEAGGCFSPEGFS